MTRSPATTRVRRVDVSCFGLYEWKFKFIKLCGDAHNVLSTEGHGAAADAPVRRGGRARKATTYKDADSGADDEDESE